MAKRGRGLPRCLRIATRNAPDECRGKCRSPKFPRSLAETDQLVMALIWLTV
jgi:hypothetical protein